jgi:hypothetical protein
LHLTLLLLITLVLLGRISGTKVLQNIKLAVLKY